MIGLSNENKRAWLLVGKVNARAKKPHARELARNQPILRFDVILPYCNAIGQSNNALSI